MGSAPLWVLSGYGIVIRWWLRSPGSSSSSAAFVSYDGARFDYDVDNTMIAVRPALWVNLESKIF